MNRDREIKTKARLLANIPDFFHILEEDLKNIGVVHLPEAKAIYTSFMSCKTLPPINPISGTIAGKTQTGKSTLIYKIASLFPGDIIEKATSFSNQALIYAGNLLTRKVLIISEKIVNQDVIFILRDLISRGKANRWVVVNNKLTQVKVEGPTVIWDTTSQPLIVEEENRNRVFELLLESDDTARKNIAKHIFNDHCVNGLHNSVERTDIQAKYHEYFNMLKPVKVVIPEEWEGFISDPQDFRAASRIHDFLCTITFIKQYQRKPVFSKHNQLFIRAENEDYRDLYNILSNINTLNIEETMSLGTIKLIKYLQDNLNFKEGLAVDANQTKPPNNAAENLWITRPEILGRIGGSYTSTKRHLNELVDHGYLEKREKYPHYYRVVKKYTRVPTVYTSLIPPDELFYRTKHIEPQKSN